ncbi:hypothetical protein F1988_05000 [Alistipes indistinctus]|nr:hypothetical protein F1988_05000 [Alistipes indistinctus]
MIDYGVKINVGGNAATVMGQLFTTSQKLDAIMQKLNSMSSKLGDTYRRTGTYAQQATQKAESGFKRVSTAIGDARQKLDKLNFGFHGLGSKLAGLGLSIGVVDIGRRIINAGGTEEDALARLRFALKDEGKARAMLGDLKQMGRTMPIAISDIYKQAGFLAPVFKENTQKYLKMFANVVAGSGGDFGNIAFNFAQIKQLGRSQGIDLKQFAYQNIPIFEELSKLIGKSTEEILKMSTEGKISFDIVAKAFENMTKEGGIYFGAVEARAKTFRGQWQIIANKLEEIWVKFFEKARPYLQQFSDWVEKTIESFDEWWPKLQFWGKLAIKIGAVVLAFKTLAEAIGIAKMAMTAFTVAANLNPVILALTAAGTLAVGLASNFDSLSLSVEGVTKVLKGMSDAWRSIAERMRLTILGVQEAMKGHLGIATALFAKSFGGISFEDKESAKEYDRLKLNNASRVDRQIMQIYQDELTGGGVIAVTKKRLDAFFKEQTKKIKEGGLGNEYTAALQKIYNTYKPEQNMNAITAVNTDLSPRGVSGNGGIKNFEFNNYAPIVQINDNHVDGKTYTPEEIGQIAAKEIVNTLSQIAVQ